MDLLQQSAKVWKEIIEYRYLFTYGYKKQLYPIHLTYSLEDYQHKHNTSNRSTNNKSPNNIMTFGRLTY